MQSDVVTWNLHHIHVAFVLTQVISYFSSFLTSKIIHDVIEANLPHRLTFNGHYRDSTQSTLKHSGTEFTFNPLQLWEWTLASAIRHHDREKNSLGRFKMPPQQRNFSARYTFVATKCSLPLRDSQYVPETAGSQRNVQKMFKFSTEITLHVRWIGCR